MDQLQRSRGVLQAAATMLISSTTETLQAEHLFLTDLQVKDDLQDKHLMLAAFNEKITDLMSDCNMYEEEATVALDSRDNIASHVCYLLNSVLRHGDVLAHRVVADAGTQTFSTQTSSRALTRVALPKIQVPVFSGELRMWQGSWEHFKATIHNCELSNSEVYVLEIVLNRSGEARN